MLIFSALHFFLRDAKGAAWRWLKQQPLLPLPTTAQHPASPPQLAPPPQLSCYQPYCDWWYRWSSDIHKPYSSESLEHPQQNGGPVSLPLKHFFFFWKHNRQIKTAATTAPYILILLIAHLLTASTFHGRFLSRPWPSKAIHNMYRYVHLTQSLTKRFTHWLTTLKVLNNSLAFPFHSFIQSLSYPSRVLLFVLFLAWDSSL